jgi:hypothetical protein
MKKKSNFFRKYHKWIGIIVSLFILLFTVSGVILNHRKLFSSVDVNRDYLPQELQYNNWNLASVKSTLKISEDSILVYGNIGVYLTDYKFEKFHDFNIGFPRGIDNRKVEKVYQTRSDKLLAATLFGLYEFNEIVNDWEKIDDEILDKHIVDIAEDDEGLMILTRSELIRTSDLKTFEVFELPNPVGYDNKIGLFKTIWVIHSGEIYGTAGKFIVDFFGILFSIMAITGIIFFTFPSIIKKRKKKRLSAKTHLKTIKISLNWHKRIGWSLGLFLFFTAFTGMFLRPPLLIPIANAKVSKIPFTELDTPNAWFDKLRRIIYKPENNTYYIATIEGLFYSDDNFKSELKQIPIDVPLSVMGINVFEFNAEGMLLVGTFNGLFELNLASNTFVDYITKKPYVISNSRGGSPIGENMAAGYSNDLGNEFYFDYNKGLTFIDGSNSVYKMPFEIQQSRISLWNTALEMHTARLFKFAFGELYILFIPLFGLSILFVVVSGTIVVFRQKRKKKKGVRYH